MARCRLGCLLHVLLLNGAVQTPETGLLTEIAMWQRVVVMSIGTLSTQQHSRGRSLQQQQGDKPPTCEKRAETAVYEAPAHRIPNARLFPGRESQFGV